MEKKNPDYEKSAINLCNPPEVRDLLLTMATTEGVIKTLKARLDENDDYRGLMSLETKLQNYQGEIRAAIDKYGSFQDVEAGVYGLAYARRSVTYRPRDIKEKFPKYAGAVIEEVVNGKVLESLVKAGAIDADLAETCADVKEIKSYVIK